MEANTLNPLSQVSRDMERLAQAAIAAVVLV
jgi:hypothetical protein